MSIIINCPCCQRPIEVNIGEPYGQYGVQLITTTPAVGTAPTR